MTPSRTIAWLILLVLIVPAPATMAAEGGAVPPPDRVCVELRAGAIPPDAWAPIDAAIFEVIGDRPDLFPSAAYGVRLGSVEPAASLETRRYDISADSSGNVDEMRAFMDEPSCLAHGADWSIRMGRDFLEHGADRMLALAPTTPGIDSSVGLEWLPAETRIRTTLTFKGPFDIPNGTCWIDDRLGVDDAGAFVTDRDQGLRTSLFAESACGRFFDYLVLGGAGEQAIRLFPSSIVLDDGSTLRFVARAVGLDDDGLTLSGELALTP